MLELLEVMRCATSAGGHVLCAGRCALCAGGCEGRAACAVGAGGCALRGGGRGERALYAGVSDRRATFACWKCKCWRLCSRLYVACVTALMVQSPHLVGKCTTQWCLSTNLMNFWVGRMMLMDGRSF